MLLIAPAGAQSDFALGRAEAGALYDQGLYAAAAEAAGVDATATAQALAARSYASAAILADEFERANTLSDAALARAEAAVALDPQSVEARLELIIALWLDGRRRGDLDAYFRGVPQRSRNMIDAVLADAPEDPWAHSLDGAWHLEAIRRGGGMARRMLGADEAVGVAAFERAMALDPDDPVIAVQAAVSYLALDADDYAERARAAFERALAVAPDDAFERSQQERASLALALMEAGDSDALSERIAFWVSGPAAPEPERRSFGRPGGRRR